MKKIEYCGIKFGYVDCPGCGWAILDEDGEISGIMSSEEAALLGEVRRWKIETAADVFNSITGISPSEWYWDFCDKDVLGDYILVTPDKSLGDAFLISNAEDEKLRQMIG